MDGPHVSYVATARDAKHVQVLLHGRVNRCTVLEAEQLRDQLNQVIDEAHRRGSRQLEAQTHATVTELFGRRP